jgi:serine/threonine protein kinase
MSSEPDGERQVPGYQILKPVGKGGMGEVYLARDETLHREVAIKFVSRLYYADSEYRDRFLREARVMATPPTTI